MAKFKEGEEVMAAHDMPKFGLEQADVLIVEVPQLVCGHVLMQGKPHHFNEEDFESMNRPVVPIGGLDKEDFLMGVNRLMQLPYMAANQGFIPIEAYRMELNIFIGRMKMEDAYNKKFE